MKKKQTIEELKKEGVVTTANNIPPKTMLDEILEDKKKDKWVTEIEEYCNLADILPQDLINLHKLSKTVNLGLKSGKAVKVQDLTKENSVGTPFKPDRSLWRSNYINKKIGRNEN